jgi:hypothetical protein
MVVMSGKMHPVGIAVPTNHWLNISFQDELPLDFILRLFFIPIAFPVWYQTFSSF